MLICIKRISFVPSVSLLIFFAIQCLKSAEKISGSFVVGSRGPPFWFVTSLNEVMCQSDPQGRRGGSDSVVMPTVRWSTLIYFNSIRWVAMKFWTVRVHRI